MDSLLKNIMEHLRRTASEENGRLIRLFHVVDIGGAAFLPRSSHHPRRM